MQPRFPCGCCLLVALTDVSQQGLLSFQFCEKARRSSHLARNVAAFDLLTIALEFLPPMATCFCQCVHSGMPRRHFLAASGRKPQMLLLFQQWPGQTPHYKILTLGLS